MPSNESTFEPDYAFRPGELLERKLKTLGIRKGDFADYCGRPNKTISEIISGKTAITPETAIQFERVLGISAKTWLNMEFQFKLHNAKKRESSELAEHVTWVKNFPVSTLVKKGFIEPPTNNIDSVRKILDFFGISNPETIENIWAERTKSFSFKQSTKMNLSHYAIYAWLRAGEVKASEISCAPFNRVRFEALLKDVRHYSRMEWSAVSKKLVTECAACGVAFVPLSDLPGTGLSGAARWLNNGKALLQLSDRNKRDDQLWFAFFHEAAHILLHSKDRIFIDNELKDYSSSEDAADDIEKLNREESEADQFAERALILYSEWKEYFDLYPKGKGRFSKKNIEEYAEKIGIAPSIILGQFQRRKYLPYRTVLNKLRKKIEI